MVRDPINADDDETQHKGSQRWHQRSKRLKRKRATVWHMNIKDQQRDDNCEDAVAESFQSGFVHRPFVRLKLTKIVLTEPIQLENAASAEADCPAGGETIRLCCSLYSLGDNEKLRLNAFVKEA